MEERTRITGGVTGLMCAITKVYEAAEDENAWPDFLEIYAELVKATSGTILGVHRLDSAGCRVIASVHMDDSHQPAYRASYSSVKIRMERPRLLLGRPGAVIVGTQVCSQEESLSRDSVDDSVPPQRTHHSMGAVLLNEGSAAFYIISLRPKCTEPFSRQEIRVLQLLIPHLRRALRLGTQARAAAGLAASLSNALDRMLQGCVLIDSRGQVVFMNSAAVDLLRNNDGLTVTQDGIAARLPGDSRRLRAAIARALGKESSQSGAGGLSISHGAKGQDLQVMIEPLRSRPFVPAPSAPRAVLFLAGAGPAPAPDHRAALSQLYGLTQAEARLTASLMSGSTLDEAAAEFKISIETARSQLKRVFLKTGTSRQADLIRVLFLSPGALRTSTVCNPAVSSTAAPIGLLAAVSA